MQKTDLKRGDVMPMNGLYKGLTNFDSGPPDGSSSPVW